MPVEATSRQCLATGNWASYLFCSPPWPCCWDLHCELPHIACTSFRERGHGNATLSDPCLSSFPSLCHWGYRESIHKSRSPQRLDSSWTRGCLSCFDWIPWGYSQWLGLKQRENLYWKQNRWKQKHLAPQMNTWAMPGVWMSSTYCRVRSCFYFRSPEFKSMWSRDLAQIKIKFKKAQQEMTSINICLLHVLW